MPELPSGTVTFLFTDVEGSTKLLHELGARAYAEALAEHRRVLREAFTTHGGVEVDARACCRGALDHVDQRVVLLRAVAAAAHV